MTAETLKKQLQDVRDYIGRGMAAEAAWLFSEIMSSTAAGALSQVADEIEKIPALLPPEFRNGAETLIEPMVKRRATRRKAEEKTLEKTLKNISGIQRRPDLAARAFGELMAMIGAAQADELERHRGDIEKAAAMFQRKKQKEILDSINSRLAPEPLLGDYEDNVDAGFAIEFMIGEIRDALTGREKSVDDAFVIFSDLVNVFDSGEIITARDSLESLIPLFPRARRTALDEILALRAGKKAQPPSASHSPSPAAHPPPPPPLPPADAKSPSPPPREKPPVPISPISRKTPGVVTITSPQILETIEVCGFTLTFHARDRIARRGVTVEDIQTAITFGQNIYAQGAQFFRIRRKEVNENPEESRRLRRLEGLHVVCSGDSIMTVYKNRDEMRLKV